MEGMREGVSSVLTVLQLYVPKPCPSDLRCMREDLGVLSVGPHPQRQALMQQLHNQRHLK